MSIKICTTFTLAATIVAGDGGRFLSRIYLHGKHLSLSLLILVNSLTQKQCTDMLFMLWFYFYRWFHFYFPLRFNMVMYENVLNSSLITKYNLMYMYI